MASPLTDSEVEQLVDRMCTDKQRFGRSVARDVAQRMRARGRRVSPYRCPLCSTWHVGHVPSIESVARIAQLIRQRAYPPTEETTAR